MKIPTKTTVAALSAGMLSLPILSAQEAETKAGAGDEKAEKIMEDVATFYRGVKTLSVDASMHVEQSIPEDFGGGEQKIDITHTLSLKRPGHFAQVTKGDSEMKAHAYAVDGTVTVILDGESVIQGKQEGPLSEAFRDERFGYQKDADSNMIIDQNTSAAILRSLLFDSEKRPWNKNITAIRYGGETENDGAKAHKIILTSNQAGGPGAPPMEVDVELVVAQGETPKLLSLKPDMAKLIAEMAKGNPAFAKMKMSIRGSFANWNIDGDVPDGAFKPAIPEDAKTHESFAKLIESMNPPGGGEGIDRPDPNGLVGSDAPGFELTMLDDSKFKLADQKDKKVVILDFWATWCPPCVRALPILMEGAREFADKGVILIGVNQREDPAEIKSFLEKKDWDLKVALDTEGTVGGQYRVSGIPQTVIVGKDGKVKNVHVGLSPTLKEDLKKELEALTKE